MDKSSALDTSNDLAIDVTSRRRAKQPPSKPQRTHLPKRFDFISKERQLELFPRHGERILAYRRQVKPKSSGSKARQPRKKASQAATKPTTPISLTPSNSDVRPSGSPQPHYFSSHESPSSTHDFKRSTSANFFSTFSSGQASVSEGLCNPSTSEFLTPCAPEDCPPMTSSCSMAGPFIPQNDQLLQNSGFMLPIAHNGGLSNESCQLDGIGSAPGAYSTQVHYYSTTLEAETVSGFNGPGEEYNDNVPSFNGALFSQLDVNSFENAYVSTAADQDAERLWNPQHQAGFHRQYSHFNGQFNTNNHTDGFY